MDPLFPTKATPDLLTTETHYASQPKIILCKSHVVLTVPFFVFHFGFRLADATGCEIDPLATSSPLLIKSDTTEFVYPNYGETTVKFDIDEAVDLACPGGTVLGNGEEIAVVAKATCVSNFNFQILKQTYRWTQLSCSSEVVSTARYTAEECDGGLETQVGFSLENGRFLELFKVCFKSETKEALYSRYQLVSVIGAASTGSPRPQFYEDDGFYNLMGNEHVNTVYTRSKQRKVINKVVGLDPKSEKYIQGDQLHFLSRGHLAARSEFFYPAQQNATFRYINAAPQWQSFNGYNWNQIETDTRNYVSTKGVDFQVWTGVFGIATLPHETTGEDVDLHLYVKDDGTYFPVPALYWKLLYDPLTSRGVVLIGLNNPYETDVSKRIICDDVIDQLSWLNLDKTNVESGYAYACTISDFRKVVGYAPDLQDVGLLL